MQASLSMAEEVALHAIMVRDYYSMLTSVATHDPLQLYSDEMAADPEEYGIIRTETPGGYSYTMVAGMEDQPMNKLSQQQQDYYTHWVEQDSPQGEEELASPLMMFQEPGKEDLEKAQQKLALEQQQQQRNREAIDGRDNDSSSLQQRGPGPAAIKEKSDPPPPIAVIRIDSPPDDLSEITGDNTTADSHHPSPSFSPKGDDSKALMHQAEHKLREARKEVIAARQHFDLSQARWEVFQNLQQISNKHQEVQQQFSLNFHKHQQALITFQQAQAAACEAWQRQEPSFENLNNMVSITAAEVNKAFQEYQPWFFQAQVTSRDYSFAQQRAAQQGLVPGVDYTSLFEQAQVRVNRAVEQLEKCQEELRRAKFNKLGTPKQNKTATLPKKNSVPAPIPAPVSIERFVATEEEIREGEKGSSVVLQQAEVAAKSSGSDSGKVSYQDQGTQISKEDLAVWEREAFLKQQVFWKKRFHRMVMQLKEVKKALVADVAKELLHEVPKELTLNVPQTSLAEERDAVEKEKKMALAPTIMDALIEEVLSDKWGKPFFKKIAKEAKKELLIEQQQAMEKLHLEKKNLIFQQLFSGGEITEREKWEQQQESIASIRRAREQERAEMEHFCTERVNLLHPAEEAREEGVQQPEVKNLVATVVPVLEQARGMLTQCYRHPYEWCTDAIQLMRDWMTVQVEAGKVTEKFFADQGRRIIDVPTQEYAWKNGLVAQQLYNEIVAKRKREQAAVQATPRERDPREELGYLEQMPLMFEGPIFKRFVTNFFVRKNVDFNRESDQRALDYFKEIGKPDPRIFEFWKKSAEIEKQLQQARLEKAKELLEQFPDDAERIAAARQWGLAWRERLEQEREQKKKELSEQELFAKEEQRQRIVQAVLDQRAAEEAKRQKIEQELLAQVAKEKEQKQTAKKKTAKRK